MNFLYGTLCILCSIVMIAGVSTSLALVMAGTGWAFVASVTATAFAGYGANKFRRHRAALMGHKRGNGLPVFLGLIAALVFFVFGTVYLWPASRLQYIRGAEISKAWVDGEITKAEYERLSEKNTLISAMLQPAAVLRTD